MQVLFVDPITFVFFLYGLAFYTMGLAVALESGGHIADRQIRRAMLLLATFGLIHGLHEWFEMFVKLAETMSGFHVTTNIEITRIVILVISFGILCLFGFQMLYPENPRLTRRAIIIILAIFGMGAVPIVASFTPDPVRTLHALDSWGRYSLGMTGGALAGIGLILRARDYRQLAHHRVARGWLVAGSALVVYGVIGQSAPSPSDIFPATVYNAAIFQSIFGFPIQLLRAGAAVTATVGLINALWALELERQKAIQATNRARLEAQTQAQEEMARRQELQTELLRRTVTAQEEERSRLARELHDETGQILTALNYSAAVVKSTLECGDTPDHNAVTRVYDLASQALADLRRIVTDLRPAQLDDLGLVAAVSWLGDQAHERLNLDVQTTIQGRKQRLPDAVETALFRITQEALTNAAKHAKIDFAEVRLTFNEDTVILEIRDEGTGFDVEKALQGSGNSGWGIIGMRERAASVGGELALISIPGQGTTVRAVIPMPGEES